MINASISEDGSIILSAFGNDADTLKTFGGSFEVVPVGSSINPKTGRKHFVIKLVVVEEDKSTKGVSAEKEVKPTIKKKITAKEESEFKDRVERSYPKPEVSDIYLDSDK